MDYFLMVATSFCGFFCLKFALGWAKFTRWSGQQALCNQFPCCPPCTLASTIQGDGKVQVADFPVISLKFEVRGFIP